MPKLLITAYGPYDDWGQNASWLTLQAFLRDRPTGVDLVTRLYPVEFAAVRDRLQADLAEPVDAIIHLGQAPGAGRIALEAIGLNVGQGRAGRACDAFPLASDGPVAYHSALPLDEWEELLGAEGVPAAVSYHAGTYLCNAALYFSHYLCEQAGRPTPATFLHLPLDPSQVVGQARDLPSLPVEESARALHLIVSDLQQRLARIRDAAEIA